MPNRSTRLVALGLALLALTGCSTYFPVNRPIDELPEEGYRARRRWAPERSNEHLIIVSFSGGGTRAAAFAYGVLQELDATRARIGGRERSLLDEVDHITGVSGGSFPAAYFGLHGRGIFEDFEERFLRRDVQTALIFQLLIPVNWVLLFSPYFERSDLVARYYDRILFDGASFGDLAAGDGPLIQINATDLATGSPFSFIQEQFDYLCSDLGSYPISRAVAASSAVPGPMSPLTLRNFAGRCAFDPPEWVARAVATPGGFGREYVNARNLQSYMKSSRRRFIRLVDGGVADNLGVRGPFEGSLLQHPPRDAPPDTFRDMRHMVMVIVNAATTPEIGWEAIDEAPALFDIIDQTASVQINRFTIETLELLRSIFAAWNEVAASWDEPVHFHLVELDFSKPGDAGERAYLNSLPTSFRLGDEAVDRLIRAGRETLRDAPAFRALIETLAAED